MGKRFIIMRIVYYNRSNNEQTIKTALFYVRSFINFFLILNMYVHLYNLST